MQNHLPAPIELTLPAEPRLVRLARLLASGVGTMLGLTLEDVEDLRIAVDELCSTLVEAGNGTPISLRFEAVQGALVVRGHTTHAEPVDRRRLDISRQILAVVADHQSIEHEGNLLRFTIARKLRADGVG